MDGRAQYVLIVNGDSGLASLYAEMISMDTGNYITGMSSTGADCLKVVTNQPPDLILLDIELPDMDGWELIEKIRMLEPDIPTIVITAKPPGLEDISRLNMVCEYLVRPVTLDCLQVAVQDALEVPAILNECIENVRKSPSREDVICSVEENIRLMQQNIIDRKIFMTMKQMYPGNTNPEATRMLGDLKRKIDRAQDEIETFKRYGVYRST
ncbi:MAG TPA: response regulator [Candidatus Methanoperedenaceae archaeon]|nr:response regulator [Candidatus Methanoperedenaceae archaeon]